MKNFPLILMLFITSFSIAQIPPEFEYFADGYIAYYDDNNTQKGLALWKKAADLDHRGAQYELGLHYLKEYVAQQEDKTYAGDKNYTTDSEEYRKGKKWMKKAYLNGNEEAEYPLFVLLEIVFGNPDAVGWEYLMTLKDNIRFYYNPESIESIGDTIFVTAKYEFNSIQRNEYDESYDTMVNGFLIKCSSATMQIIFENIYLRGENVDYERTKTNWGYAGSPSSDFGKLTEQTCR